MVDWAAEIVDQEEVDSDCFPIAMTKLIATKGSNVRIASPKLNCCCKLHGRPLFMPHLHPRFGRRQGRPRREPTQLIFDLVCNGLNAAVRCGRIISERTNVSSGLKAVDRCTAAPEGRMNDRIADKADMRAGRPPLKAESFDR